MIVKNIGLFIAALFLSTYSTSALATPLQILIIRHGEKDGGNGLSTLGFERAQKLVSFFETDPQATVDGIPVAIFAMAQNGLDGSIRPIQTVTPLAEALGLTVQTPFVRDDYPSLVKSILSNPSLNGKKILICWEHKVIPAMAAAFGVKPQPADWDDSDFDTVYEINYSGDQVSSFKEFQENVLN